jgi:hypothetical protein
MIPNLPIPYVGHLEPTVRAAQREREGMSRVLSDLVEGRVEVILVRERRLTIALAVRQIQPGMCLISRDGKGRGLYIGPSENTILHEFLQEAA